MRVSDFLGMPSGDDGICVVISGIDSYTGGRVKWLHKISGISGISGERLPDFCRSEICQSEMVKGAGIGLESGLR